MTFFDSTKVVSLFILLIDSINDMIVLVYAGGERFGLYVVPSDYQLGTDSILYDQADIEECGIFVLHTSAPYVRQCRTMDPEEGGWCDYFGNLYPDIGMGPFSLGVWWHLE